MSHNCSWESFIFIFFPFSGELKVMQIKKLIENSINQCKITSSGTKINGANSHWQMGNKAQSITEFSGKGFKVALGLVA